MTNNLRSLLVGADGLLPRIEWLAGKLEEIEATNSNIGNLNARILLTLLQNNCNNPKQIVDREQVSLRTGNGELERRKVELESSQRELATGQEALKADRERLEGEKQVLAAERESLNSEKDQFEAGKTELEAASAELISQKEAFLVVQTAVERDKDEVEDDKVQLDEKRKAIETSTSAQQELDARWDEKIDSILGELKGLNLSTGLP
ncbi:hypothetical protein RRF57_013408 [Xylaria bambusicola]|uniref:Uncharacterized protein n=1 Tax=Xylaria bambusicola TaxID=326684 RepID=A0AAN7UY22_9PEZI